MSNYLTSLQLQYYKQFADVLLLPHQNLNVIIGNNGEGKSNLLASISELFNQNAAEGRRRAITTGQSASLVTGQFNSFIIAKQIQQKFEAFQLNGKDIVFKQLKFYLESLGIVQLAFIRQNDCSLLQNLHDLYDITDFNERQLENRKSLEKAQQLQLQASSQLDELRLQAETLQNETGDLLQYQEVLGTKAAAERAICDFDLAVVKRDIEQREAEQSTIARQIAEARQEDGQIASEKEINEQQIQQLETSIQQQQTMLAQEKAQKLELDELIAQSPEYFVSVQSQSQSVESVQQQILQLNIERDELTQNNEKLKIRLQAQQLAVNVGSAEEINSQIGRLREQIVMLGEQIGLKQSEMKNLVRPEEVDSSNAKQRYQLELQRQQRLQLESQNYQKQHQQLSFDFGKSLTELYRTLPQAVYAPLQFLQNYTTQHQNVYANKYFGPLFYNIQFDSGLLKLVDSAVGMQLFSIVVDTEETAISLIAILNTESQIQTELKNSRVQFLPLSNFQQELQEMSLPEGSAQLSSLIQGKDAQMQHLVNQLFGKQVVCQNMEIARNVARQYRCDCYTIDGDSFMQSGLISGGYRNPVRTRCCKDAQSQAQQLDKVTLRLRTVQEELQQVNVQVQQLQATQIREEAQQSKILEKFQEFRNQQLRLTQEIQLLQSQKEDAEQQVQTLKGQLNSSNLVSSQTLSPEEVTQQIAANELKLFQIQQQLKFLQEKQQVGLQKQTDLQILLDVQLSRLRRCLITQKVSDNVSFGEAAELAQRRSNELLESVKQISNLVSQETAQLSELYALSQQLSGRQQKNDAQLQKCQLQLDQNQVSLNVAMQKQQQIQLKLLTLAQPQGSLTFSTRAEALQVAGQAAQKLTKFNVNKLAAEQYQLLSQKIQSSELQLQNLENEQKDLELAYENCQQKFETNFQREFDAVRASYSQFLYYLTEKTGQIEANTSLELKVDVPGVPSSGQQAAARISYILALQSKQPILLLDETDAFLDIGSKQKYAQLLKQLSQQKQIFVVSFSRCVCELSDKVFKVENGKVQELEKEVAVKLDFLV